MPIPIRLLRWIIDRVKYPVLTVGACVFGGLIGFYLITGSFYPAWLIESQSSPLEAMGLFLLLSILPAYLMMCLVSFVRNTSTMSMAIERILPESNQLLLNKLDDVRSWPVWVVISLVFAVTENISWDSLDFTLGNIGFWFSISIVVGQSALWAVVGLVLAVYFHNSLLLHKLGKLVEVNIYNLESLNPFGRFSLTGLLMLVGTLALMPLQSIDAEFRWNNYLNALFICIPAALVFMLLPTWALHRRILGEKRTQLDQLNEKIVNASRSLEVSHLEQLNALLERRKYIQNCRSWPMDMSIFSRVVFYVLIPPLAWAGAALTELALDSYLVG